MRSVQTDAAGEYADQADFMIEERRKDFTKRAELSENFFRTMFQMASVGMAVASTEDRRLVDVNPKFCQITGYTREELLELCTPELTHPDDRELDSINYACAAGASAAQHLTEKRYVRKDGSVVWVRVNAAYLLDDAGKPFRTLTVVEDITGRVQAETALRESERRLMAFLDGIPDRARLTDPEGRYLAANLSEARALGASSVAEILGKTLYDFRPGDHARRVDEEARMLMATGQTLRVQRLMQDGIWAEMIKVPLFDEQGKVTGLVTIARDVTERKRIEDELLQSGQRLRESARQLRALLDTLPFRAWLKDAHGHYVAANRSASEFFGLGPTGIIGKTAEDLFPPDLLAQINAEDARIMASRQPVRVERQYGPDGHWFETIKTPLIAPDGSASGLVAISRDVTERRQAEAELRAAKAAAEEANRAKSEFLSHMSHEMRTPMNAILGFAELALLEQPDASQCEHLAKITAATKSLLRVIDDVLDYERADAGKLQLEAIEFTLGDVLQNVRDVVERTANAKGLALRFTVGKDVPLRLIGDPSRITQVLLNLCANAVKFTANGYVEVVARTERADGDRVTLHIEVRDTGIGISAEELSRLFQPFSQADSSTTRRYGGTGLGLVICKRLVELMGGRTWIDSEPDEGTTVSFTLECKIDAQAAPVQAQIREQWPEEAAALYGKRVLVVDDHPINRMLMAKLLRLAGAHAVPAENGVDALRVLEQESRVDLVLMDLRMPEMDGYETTRRIRADQRWSKMPIVAVTASAATYERARCMAAGMNDVMVKPIHQSVFFPVIAAIMKRDGNS